MSSLQLGSDTLAGSPASGQVEYNGQYYGTDSNSSRAQFERLVLATSQATTSGTSITFSSIPAWVKRITVMLNGVSTNGTSVVQLQLGAGSVTTSGYVSGSAVISGTNTTSVTTLTSGFSTLYNQASDTRYGNLIITNISGNIWVISGILVTTAGVAPVMLAGQISLSGTLDRVVLTTVNGTDTFDAGTANILYEG